MKYFGLLSLIFGFALANTSNKNSSVKLEKRNVAAEKTIEKEQSEPFELDFLQNTFSPPSK